MTAMTEFGRALIALLDVPGFEAVLGETGARVELGRTAGDRIGKQSAELAAVALAMGKARTVVDKATADVRDNIADLVENALGVDAREAFAVAHDATYAETLAASSRHPAGRA